MRRYFVLTMLLVNCLNIVGQDEWYKKVDALIDDPYGFDNSFHPYYKKGLTLEGSFASGKYYAKFKKKEFDRIAALPAREELLEILKVTDANKKAFANQFNKIGNAEVPFIVNILGELNPYLGYATLLLSLVDQAGDDRKTKANVLSDLIATGAEFERRLAFSEKETGQWYVNVLTIYKVNVANETRRYIISRSVLAVKIE